MVLSCSAISIQILSFPRQVFIVFNCLECSFESCSKNKIERIQGTYVNFLLIWFSFFINRFVDLLFSRHFLWHAIWPHRVNFKIWIQVKITRWPIYDGLHQSSLIRQTHRRYFFAFQSLLYRNLSDRSLHDLKIWPDFKEMTWPQVIVIKNVRYSNCQLLYPIIISCCILTASDQSYK